MVAKKACKTGDRVVKLSSVLHLPRISITSVCMVAFSSGKNSFVSFLNSMRKIFKRTKKNLHSVSGCIQACKNKEQILGNAFAENDKRYCAVF